MLRVEVKVNDRTKELLAELQRQQLAFVTLGGQAIRTEAVTRINNVTGATAASIQVEAYVEDGRAVSETGPTAKWAPFLEYGTGVRAVNGDGRKTPWTYKHPIYGWITTTGSEPKPFMEPGYQAAKPNIDRIFERLLK